MATCTRCGNKNITDKEIMKCEIEQLMGIYCTSCLSILKSKSIARDYKKRG